MAPKLKFLKIANPTVDPDSDEEQYIARDRNICIALAAKGHKIEHVTFEHGKRVRYHFVLADIEEDLAAFSTGDLMISAKAFFSESARFKSMMNV